MGSSSKIKKFPMFDRIRRLRRSRKLPTKAFDCRLDDGHHHAADAEEEGEVGRNFNRGSDLRKYEYGSDLRKYGYFLCW
jgi:hypothetical protein